jgi:hypothetical protein
MRHFAGFSQLRAGQTARASPQAEAVDAKIDRIRTVGQSRGEFFQIAGRRQQFGDSQEGLLGRILSTIAQEGTKCAEFGCGESAGKLDSCAKSL